MLLVLAQWTSAGTKLVSNDPNWLGGRQNFNTTEGNDFWLTFMNNATFDPTHPDNKKIKFEMKVGVSAREAMEINIAIDDNIVKTLNLAAGETQIFELDRDTYAQYVYLLSSEKDGYKGVHVYASQKDKDKYFSCFSYNRHGDPAGSLRDASLILPTRSLGKEYYIQTNSEDFYSSQFAIVATENGTNVRINPTIETFNEKPANTPFTITLSKGQAYLIASRKHKDDEQDYTVDLSGTTICSDKPIAVFNGNQETSVPINSVLKRDFATEQSIPVIQWGTDFYIALMKHTKEHYFRLTAAYNNTDVTLYTGGGSPTTITLNAGQSSEIYYVSKAKNEYKIISSQPVICYSYTPSLHKNAQEIDDIEYNLGNTSNAMIPSWSHRTKEMNFFTHEMDPEKVQGTESPQEFYVYLVTKTSDIDKITVDGATYTSSFNKFSSDASMAYANIEVGNAKAYHNVSSKGEGFIGMVYALSQAQGYHYTLGFTPNPFADSLFITNEQALMDPKSYDMDSLDGHGWYQRQWNEWIEGKERIDTAVVCDSSTVYWTLESPKERPVKQIEWSLYNITDGERTLLKGFPYSVSPAKTDTKHKYEYRFILPEEPMEDRHQFFEYELEAVIHRDQAMCGDEDRDTFKTVTRVTRMFNDTIWRAICIGDTLFFFNDSLYTQGDLSKYEAGKKDSTRFVATKTTEPNDGKWIWKVNSGQYEFQRQYLSQFGCDSIITLELFVCDTFRFVDTIHLCSNQDTLYHETIFRGKDYKGKRPGSKIVKVTEDTTVQYVRFKTDSCDCQKGDLAKKYKTKDGEKFQGCDSIYELHLYIHKSYDLHIRDTLNYKENPDSTYKWKIERDGVTRDSLIKRDTPGMKWNENAQAWIGNFSDTLYTKTCKECNEGQHGCDSINSLTLVIPPVYRDSDTITWCRLSYDWNKHDTLKRDFQWKGHHGDITYAQGGDYYDSCLSRYNADSIYYLHLVYSEAKEPLYELYKDTVCFDSLTAYVWKVTDPNTGRVMVNNDSIRQDIRGTSYYIDDSRCDTIYALELYVLPAYFIVDTVKKTQEETYKWEVNGKTYGGAKTTEDQCDTIIKTSEYIEQIDFLTDSVGTYQCDSIHKLILHFGNVYRDTIDSFACGQETEFIWWETRPKYLHEDGEPFVRKTISEADLPKQGQTLIYEHPFKTVLNDDSVFYLQLYRAPIHDLTDSIRVCQAAGATFNWPKHEGHKIYDAEGNVVASIPAERYGYYEYIDTIRTAYYGCDSIWHLHLYVDSVYHFTYEDTTCQFNNYVWPNQDIDSIDRPIITQHTGDSVYTASYHTIYGCDSTWTLKLHIDTVYKEAVSITPRFMCDKDTIMIYDLTIYGIKSPLRPEGVGGLEVPKDVKFIEVDTTYIAKAINGCDSLVQHRIQVYKTYSDTAWIRVGQPSEGRDSLFHWVNHDTVWDVHNSRFIPADSIPRYVKGDTTYLYIDSLRTTVCTTCERIKDGCDSLFFLFLTIDSTFHFYDTIHICENEDTLWQKIHFVGDSVDKTYWLPSDSVRKPGIYNDTVRYKTVRYLDECDTCKYDSIYYLNLIITPIYHDVTPLVYCDNDTTRAAHYYSFSDTHGNVYEHYVPFAPNDRKNEADTNSVYYNPIDTTLTDTLVTVDGCDSIVTVNIRVMPTYEFVHQEFICHSGTYDWRGNTYNVQGSYHDILQTAEGQCDSIFTLELYIKPVHLTVIYDTICDDETYWYRDTLRYVDPWGRDQESITEYPVWSPGDPRPAPYVETYVKSMPPDICDSIIYRYYLTICQTYRYNLDTTICSGKPCYSPELNHTWNGTAFEYDTDVYVEPFDTIIVDSLTTIMGCDSIYRLYTHVLPSYRHIEYDTLCQNDSCHFRKFHFLPTSFGDTIVRDSLFTVENGCDSIYELRLSVYPKYFIEDFDTICFNDTLTWRTHLIKNAQVGDTLVYDSLETIHGCDSVFYLYLHVLPVTHKVIYDSICINDTLFVLDHQYTTSGLYIDTTVNQWGCDSIIYTYLEVIPPTVPTVWATDPMCQDEKAFDLYYTYTSHFPIAYSLYFDEVGKSMGFEDMVNIAITEYTNPMVITVPIPYRDAADASTYPKPDNYSMRLVLDNGICQHKETDCFHDSTFVMRYPSWLTEQRYGDVIALLNEKYNGGYKWSAYQWYQGGKKLVGQTNPYLYIPTGLEHNAQYHVVLTREGEKQSFPTCPITVTNDSQFKEYAPTMGYLDVAPTCVTAGHPYTNILSRHGGRYRITTSKGSAVTSGEFHADVTEIQVPSTSGMYIIQLWSDDTTEEPYRAIKIVVKDICETCATSF